MILSLLLPARNWIRFLLDRPWCRAVGVKRLLGLRCAWTVETSCLDSQSVIYSAGVGNDISFERALVECFGCAVHLFDPSPTALRTMTLPENQHRLLHFHPVGLSSRNDLMLFDSPQLGAEGSYSIQTKKSSEGIAFPCRSLASLIGERQLSHIDLLKMDIEGAEYGVLGEICEKQLPIKQICVEFHHFRPGYQIRQTRQALRQLAQIGYRVIHKNRFDYTLLKYH